MELQLIYEKISDNIGKAKEKDLAPKDQISLLVESATMEKKAEALIKELLPLV